VSTERTDWCLLKGQIGAYLKDRLVPTEETDWCLLKEQIGVYFRGLSERKMKGVVKSVGHFICLA
jgi:hypothetical protein